MPALSRSLIWILFFIGSNSTLAPLAVAEPFTISPPEQLIFDGVAVDEGTFTLYTVFELDTNPNGPDPNNLCPACEGPDFPSHDADIGANDGAHFVTDLLEQTQPVIVMAYGFDPGPPGDNSDEFLNVVFAASLDVLTLLLPTRTDAHASTVLGGFNDFLPTEAQGKPTRFQLTGLDGRPALAGSFPILGPTAPTETKPENIHDFGTGFDGEPILGYFSDIDKALDVDAGDSQPHGVTNNNVPEPLTMVSMLIGISTLLAARRPAS